MRLSKEEIQHIADLAKLKLSDGEKEIYGEQLSHILSYIDQLKEIDTTNVEPTAQVAGLKNILRNDEIIAWDDDENSKAFSQSPDKEKEQIKVKRVLN